MTTATRSPSSRPGAGVPGNYGSFRLGQLHLAVPMHALREIVPCDTLVPLRGMASCVAGGLPYGKTIVPVVDLRSALGQPLAPARSSHVLMVRHDGALLALLAHDVTGVLSGAAVVADPASPAARHANPLVIGHVPQADGRSLRVLSLDAVAALPGGRPAPKTVQRRKAAPAWYTRLVAAWRRRTEKPDWSLTAAQMSGLCDTVFPGVRG